MAEPFQTITSLQCCFVLTIILNFLIFQTEGNLGKSRFLENVPTPSRQPSYSHSPFKNCDPKETTQIEKKGFWIPQLVDETESNNEPTEDDQKNRLISNLDQNEIYDRISPSQGYPVHSKSQ